MSDKRDSLRMGPCLICVSCERQYPCVSTRETEKWLCPRCYSELDENVERNPEEIKKASPTFSVSLVESGDGVITTHSLWQVQTDLTLDIKQLGSNIMGIHIEMEKDE